MIFSWVVDRFSGAGLHVRQSGDEAQINCPYCGDQKQRLYFNLEKGVWTCFHCNEKGRLDKLFKTLGLDLLVPPRKRSRGVKSQEREPVSWPDSNKISIPSSVWSYLSIRRGWKKVDLDLWQVRQGQGKWEDFVLFPVLDRERALLGIHGRRFRFTGPKAINHPSGQDKAVLGMHLVPVLNPERIVVVEGPYDAVHVTRELHGTLGLALMGHGITPLQTLQISSLRLPTYLMLDGDAWKAAKEMERNYSRWAPCKAVRLDKGDPDEYNGMELAAIINAK
jgi:hypothetical protein